MAQWGTTEPDENSIKTQRLDAPWTDEQVEALNRFQASGVMHGFTCGGSVHDNQPLGTSRPLLLARRDGWVCVGGVDCDYRQSWAHSFMADPAVLDDMDEQRKRLFGEFFDRSSHRRRGAAKMRTAQAPKDTDIDDELVEQACEVMRDAYEQAALGTGWVTNPESRKPWSGVPENNKATMRAAVRALLEWLEQQ